MSLIQFVCDNDLEGVKRLIQNGVDVNGVVDAFGCTALWYAAYEGRVKCAATILDAKADVDKASVNGYTPLHRASCNGHAECVRVCRSCGPMGVVGVWIRLTLCYIVHCSSSFYTRPT